MNDPTLPYPKDDSSPKPAMRTPGMMTGKSAIVDPVTLLGIVAQTAIIKLEGFNSPAPQPLSPGVRFVGLKANGRFELSSELAWQAARTRRILWVSAALVFFGLVIGGLSIGASRVLSNTSSHSVRPLPWQVTTITPQGVWLRTDHTAVPIPVGGKLPNGETLVATDTERRSYTTSGGTVFLNKGIKP